MVLTSTEIMDTSGDWIIKVQAQILFLMSIEGNLPFQNLKLRLLKTSSRQEISRP